MTVYFKSHEITILRQKSIGSNKYNFSATFTALSADIQPAAAERVEALGGRIGKTYEAWIDTTYSVKEGDQVRVIGSARKYGVRAVSTWSGAGMLDHIHLILVSED